MGRSLFRMNTVLYVIILVLLGSVLILLNERCTPEIVDNVYKNEQTIRKFPLEEQDQSNQNGNNLPQVAQKETVLIRKKSPLYDQNYKEYEYGEDTPLIFIGGVPRSGTTLMRAMLDAHPLVRCGEETRVIPRLLGMRATWKRNKKESKRLEEAGVSDTVIDAALSAFILEVIARHAPPAPRLCNKDPFALKSMEYLAQLFPKAKFVLMIRDGRATVNSIITRKVTITGFDLTNYRQCLTKWNQAISTMYQQCYNVGETRCFPMYYEQLVLQPEKWMRELSKFLELPWNSSVLNHEDFVGKKISLSKVERSTDQVIKPVNLDALSKWVGQMPDDVVKDMPNIAPMLAHLGYDPLANPPNYGQANERVIKNTEDLHAHLQEWDMKAKSFVNGTKSIEEMNNIANIKNTPFKQPRLRINGQNMPRQDMPEKSMPIAP